MPERENLPAFAATGATLAIHLSVHVLENVVKDLTPHYGPDCPVAVVWRATWPDERIVRATLSTLQTAIGAEMERVLSPALIVTPQYGTRASTILSLSNTGHVLFREHTRATDGRVTGAVEFSFDVRRD